MALGTALNRCRMPCPTHDAAGMLDCMKQWFSKDLGDGMMAYLPLEEILAEFTPRFEAAGRPDDMALFKRHELGSELFCNATAYLSPAAAEIAHACLATPCVPPPADDITLVAGNETCWTQLFGAEQK